MLDEQNPLALKDEHDFSHAQSAEEMEREERALMEQFLQDPAHDYHNLQYGDTADGVIMQVDKDEILVNIGAKAEGVVPSREMQSLSAEDRSTLQPGDVILVFVVLAPIMFGASTLINLVGAGAGAAIPVHNVATELLFKALSELAAELDQLFAAIVQAAGGTP